MTDFLASVIEQMDLALDQLAGGDANSHRFALMLVDNAMELTLHRHANHVYAENRRWNKGDEPQHNSKLLSAAIGQHFDAKVKLAREIGLIQKDECASILILHSFRNETYHRGMRHEGILSPISLFYFRISCDVFERYKPPCWRSRIGEAIPHRARKYLGNDPCFDWHELYVRACRRLREVSEGIPLPLTEDLSSHMDTVIRKTDELIEYLADNGPQKRTRNQVIVDSQAWCFAFTDEGKRFARENACPARTMAEYLDWMSSTFSGPCRSDPIPSWHRRLESLRSETDHHTALKKYKDFMDQTEDLRQKIDDASAQLDEYIEQQIDIAREKRQLSE